MCTPDIGSLAFRPLRIGAHDATTARSDCERVTRLGLPMGPERSRGTDKPLEYLLCETCSEVMRTEFVAASDL